VLSPTTLTVTFYSDIILSGGSDYKVDRSFVVRTLCIFSFEVIDLDLLMDLW